MSTFTKENIFSAVAVICVFIFVCGCGTDKGFKSVNYGCITKDGSKIALVDFNKDFESLTSSNSLDKYRLILDGKTGNVIWKDFSSSDRLVCAEDNSIISVSDKAAKWIDSEKEIVFSKESDYGRTNFIGMTDKDTIVREERSYSQAKMDGVKRTSSVKTYSSFPAFLIDKVGENNTKTITLSDSDLEGVGKDSQFGYFFEKNRIILNTGQKVFAVDILSGKTTVLFANSNDFLKSLEKEDKFDAADTTVYGDAGFIEIYEGKGDNRKVITRVSEKDLGAKVEHIIDCCNNGLNLLYWENGNYLKIAQINPLNGQVLWKSESLLSNQDK